MSTIFNKIEKNARGYFPSFLAPLAKNIIAWPRYYDQLRRSKEHFNEYKNKYPQHILYVAGLPKSGTTWLEKMLGSFPGFVDIMIPEAVAYEQKHKQSHSFDFPEKIFSRFHESLVVCKLHAHGSLHNYTLLEKAGLHYVVLFRDLRDVAVSHVHYVQSTAYHPEHPVYKRLNTKEALMHFANTLLPQFVAWVNSWHEHRASSLSYILRYEDLLASPYEKFRDVVRHYNIQASDEEIKQIVDKNSFSNMKRNETGVDASKSFFRKGQSGDWKNYFDDELDKVYDERLREFNELYGYGK